MGYTGDMENTRTVGVRTPRQDRAKDTRRRILAAAGELFAEKGYRGTNAKEIARKAACAIGSFYAYFPDKGALFLEITEEYYRRVFSVVRESLSAAGSALPPSAAGRRALIRGLLAALYRAHDIEPALHREITLMVLAAGDDPADEEGRLMAEVRKRVEAMDRDVEAWLVALIGPLVRPAEAVPVAALIFRCCEETIHRLKQFPGTLPEPEKTLALLEDMVYSWLAARTPGG